MFVCLFVSEVPAMAAGQPGERYEEVVQADGPVAWYRFADAAGSSTLADSAGSYTATNHGITLGEEGPFDGTQAGSFNGEAYAALPSNPLAGASAFTAEAWIHRMAGTTRQPIFDFGSSASNHMYLTGASSLTGHPMLFEIRTSAGTIFQVTAPKPESGIWEYVTVTETSSGTLTLYDDGKQVGQTTGATISPSSLGSLPDDYLGKSVAEYPSYHGLLSNVAFYNKALSSERILAHYEAAAPVNVTLPSITGTTKQGRVLTAKTGSWSGVEPITFAYQWLRCNSAGGECAEIELATTTKYTLVNGDVGKTLRVAVAGTDGAGSDSVRSEQTATIEGIQPSHTALPNVSGTAEVGQLLSAGTGSWEGTTPISYAYQWEACGPSLCRHIAGATSASYRIEGAQLGKTMRVIVTASNVAGSANANSEKTALVTPGPPVNTYPPEVFGTVKAGQTLSASTGSWAGSEPFAYAYQWQSCNSKGEACSNITEATSSSYALSSSNIGHTLRVLVTAKNSVGSESATSSPSPVVGAAPPLNTQLPTITGIAQEGQTLSASPGTWSGVEPISYSYQWQRCSVGSIGAEGSGNGQFERPGDVAVDSAGALWVVDSGNDRVEEFSETGEYLRQFGAEGTGEGQLSEPSALVVDSKGDVWVADTGNDRIEEFGPSGEYLRQISVWGEESEEGTEEANRLEAPEGVAIDRDGDIWVSDTRSGELVVFNGEGEYLKTVGSQGSGPGQFGEPEGVAVDSQGDVWVADWSNDRVEEFSEQGEYVREFGSEGTGHGQFEEPDGIAVSGNGHVLVGDIGNNRVEEFNDRGEYLREFGSAGGAEPGQFELEVPMGLTVVSNGDIWLTDVENDRLEKFNEEGEYLGGHCENIAGASSHTYSPAAADVGSTLQVVVTATDADGEASATSPLTSDVLRAAPSNTVPPVVEGTAEEGQTLTATTGTWSGPSLIYAYQWESCESSGAGCSDIEGATSSTYVPGYGEIGKRMRVTVTAENSSGKASATSTASAVVVPAAPANMSAPTIEGAARDGETLSASIGSWSGTPPLTYAYQWQDCNALGESCVAIAGATSSTYVLEPGDEGASIEVVVTATNAQGTTSASSARTAVVAASPPENTMRPVIAGIAQEGETLTASSGSWNGVKPISYSYQWQRCGLVTIGSAGSGVGQFDHPAGVAIDASGNLWVLDYGNDRVEEFTEKGVYLRQFGSAGSGDGQLSRPSALAIDSKGNIWVADTGNDRIEEFSPSGEYLRQFGSLGSEKGQLDAPEGIAIGADDDVWVSDTGNARIEEFSSEGEYLRTIGSRGSAPGEFEEPDGIAVDSKGDLWVADSANYRVEEFAEDGEYIREFGSKGSGDGHFEAPYAVAVSPRGRILVGDIGNDRVEEFGEHGEYLYEFGEQGSGPGQFGLGAPMGFAVAGDEIWLTDYENDRVEAFGEQGETRGGTCENITGATASSYTATAADVGLTLQVIVTATNVDGLDSVASQQTSIVGEG
jgi:sugar lactone lactonase YvrE